MSYGKTRIELSDSIMDVVVKMSEGNPGAINAIMSLMTSTPEIDPDNIMGGLGSVLSLDSFQIYGADIYVLHRCVAGGDPVRTIAVLRAVQLGIVGQAAVHAMIRAEDSSQVDGLLAQVRERLPNFQR